MPVVKLYVPKKKNANSYQMRGGMCCKKNKLHQSGEGKKEIDEAGALVSRTKNYLEALVTPTRFTARNEWVKKHLEDNAKLYENQKSTHDRTQYKMGLIMKLEKKYDEKIVKHKKLLAEYEEDFNKLVAEEKSPPSSVSRSPPPSYREEEQKGEGKMLKGGKSKRYNETEDISRKARTLMIERRHQDEEFQERFDTLEEWLRTATTDEERAYYNQQLDETDDMVDVVRNYRQAENNAIEDQLANLEERLAENPGFIEDGEMPIVRRIPQQLGEGINDKLYDSVNEKVGSFLSTRDKAKSRATRKDGLFKGRNVGFEEEIKTRQDAIKMRKREIRADKRMLKRYTDAWEKFEGRPYIRGQEEEEPSMLWVKIQRQHQDIGLYENWLEDDINELKAFENSEEMKEQYETGQGGEGVAEDLKKCFGLRSQRRVAPILNTRVSATTRVSNNRKCIYVVNKRGRVKTIPTDTSEQRREGVTRDYEAENSLEQKGEGDMDALTAVCDLIFLIVEEFQDCFDCMPWTKHKEKYLRYLNDIIKDKRTIRLGKIDQALFEDMVLPVAIEMRDTLLKVHNHEDFQEWSKWGMRYIYDEKWHDFEQCAMKNRDERKIKLGRNKKDAPVNPEDVVLTIPKPNTPTSTSTPSRPPTPLTPEDIKTLDSFDEDFEKYESYIRSPNTPDGIADDYIDSLATTYSMILKPEKLNRMIEIAPKLKYEDSQEGELKKKFFIRLLKRTKTMMGTVALKKKNKMYSKRFNYNKRL